MKTNEADGAAQTENDDVTRPEGCPDCGGEIYREPNIRYGTRYEATAGWACLDCTWSRIDPTSGETPPARGPQCCADPQVGPVTLNPDEVENGEPRETGPMCYNCETRLDDRDSVEGQE